MFKPTPWQSMSMDELCSSIQSIGGKKVQESRKRVEKMPDRKKKEKAAKLGWKTLRAKMKSGPEVDIKKGTEKFRTGLAGFILGKE